MNRLLASYSQREEMDAVLTSRLLDINKQHWRHWQDHNGEEHLESQSYAAQWSERLRRIGSDVLGESSKILEPEQTNEMQDMFARAVRSLQEDFGDNSD